MECDHTDIEIDCGERICTGCGAILGSFIDEGAEWRVYSNTEDDPSRTGTITSELLPNSSYGSMMMRKRMPNQSEEVKSLTKLSAWSFSNHGERSWMGIFDGIRRRHSARVSPKRLLWMRAGCSSTSWMRRRPEGKPVGR